MSIPRIVHYCWFGSREIGNLESDCLNSWGQFLPEYCLRRWDESSAALEHYPFAGDAFKNGKYAFASDVVRLHALYQEGGIYFDTDVLVLRDFSGLLGHDFFIGEYKSGALNGAILGAKPKHPLIGKMLEYYKNLDFDVFKPLTIPEVLDLFVWEYPREQIAIFPPEYFYPLPLEQKEADYSQFLTSNSYCVHLWNHSWKDEFVLLKENRFLGSLVLAAKHVIRYPETYRNSGYVNRYFALLFRNLKRYGKLKLSGNG